mgnify:CR=1 FL=1
MLKDIDEFIETAVKVLFLFMIVKGVIFLLIFLLAAL